MRTAIFNVEINDKLFAVSKSLGFKAARGKTMCADDFYEGQGRLDGAMCDYTEEEKMDFLDLAYKRGVRNIEMESLAFGAFTSTIKVKAACVAVTLLNRLEGDSVKSSPETLSEYESRITQLVLEFVRKDFEVRLGWN